MPRSVLLTVALLVVLAIVSLEGRPQSDWSGSGSILDSTGGELAREEAAYNSYSNFNSRAYGYHPYYANGLFG